MPTQLQYNQEAIANAYARAFVDTASPDGGWDYAIDYAKSFTQHMDFGETVQILEDIADGYEVKFNPDFGDFTVEWEEDDE